ncbi:MAG: BrnT family toxin [Azospirillaceae bacterium]|nr:BrnT family toxin [Azospirillaceae bacterium]
MDFAWWEPKRLWTLNDRGLDFRDACHLFDGRLVYTYPSPREGEERFVTVGLIEQRFIAVVWMERDGKRRIISMRRARNGEERTYRELLG